MSNILNNVEMCKQSHIQNTTLRNQLSGACQSAGVTEELLWPGNGGKHGRHHVYVWYSAIQWPPSGFFNLLITQRVYISFISLIYALNVCRIVIWYQFIWSDASISIIHSWSRGLENSTELSCTRTAPHAHNAFMIWYTAVLQQQLVVKMWDLPSFFSYYCKLILYLHPKSKFQMQ